MTNKILLLILSVCLISFTSAIYPGETMIVEHNLTGRLFWNITENTSKLSVMPVITFNDTHISIYIKPEMPPNSFKISFMDEINQVEIYIPGKSHTRTKIVNNTIIKEVPEYIIEYRDNNTIQYVENKTTENIPIEIETNKIPLWLWIVLGIESVCLLTLIVILAKKSDDNIELKGGKKNGKRRKEKKLLEE
jgi:hypothetical protein